MSKLHCLVVEDEPLAAKVLTDYIADVPFLLLEGTFKDAILATEYLRDHTVDLLFLDIHLPKLKGLPFLKTLPQPPAVVITTAYHQYAVEGFELNVTDYLLKPFEFERFLVAVNKVRAAQIGKQVHLQPSDEKDHLFVTVQKKRVRILFADILYIESQREYVRIVTTQKEYLTKMSTHEIEALLPQRWFRRIHRSFIIAVNRIEAYTAEEVDIAGVSLPVGRGYRQIMDDL